MAGETIAAWFVVALGLAVLLWELHRVRVERRAQLAAAYLERYWEIDDALLLSEKGTDEHRRHVHRYIRLCEDEFDAARLGILDYRFWRIWHEWLSTERMRAQLAKDLSRVDPEVLRFEHVRTCLRGGPEHAWTECGVRVGRWYDPIPLAARWWG